MSVTSPSTPPDVPVCGCPSPWIEQDVVVGYDRDGEPIIETLRWRGPLCQHVLALADDSDPGEWKQQVVRWATRLLRARPATYAEPKNPPGRTLCLEKESRLCVMMNRHHASQAIRHHDARGRVDDLDPRTVRLVTRKHRNGTVELLKDTEQGRAAVRHSVPVAFLAAVQALTTGNQCARLICLPARGHPYSVCEGRATPANRACAVLRVLPEAYGKEDIDGCLDDDI